MFDDPQVVAALITAAATVFAAVIAAFIAGYLGKRIAGREKAEEERDAAAQDILFLLAVEDRHCQLHKNNSGNSYKNLVRDHVRSEKHLEWSGKYTRSKIKK